MHASNFVDVGSNVCISKPHLLLLVMHELACVTIGAEAANMVEMTLARLGAFLGLVPCCSL